MNQNDKRCNRKKKVKKIPAHPSELKLKRKIKIMDLTMKLKTN
jgi:hypothetical protein